MNKNNLLVHVALAFIIGMIFLPLYLALVAASHDAMALTHTPLPLLPGGVFMQNMRTVLHQGVAAIGGIAISQFLINSFIMSLLIALGKIILAFIAAFSLVYFQLPGKTCFFVLIFSTMLLPIEVRIVPTFQIVVSLGWLNTYAGLTMPLMVSATSTFLFKQFFRTLPQSLVEAAIMDGAGPWRFFWDILFPLAKIPMASMFIILFVYGWNQYLWPLLITSDTHMATIVMSIRYLAGVADQIPQWHYIMCIALLAMLPPTLVVMLLHRWFEKGLTPS